MKRVFAICLLLPLLFALPASAQYFPRANAFYWIDVGNDQAGLWHGGVQVGALVIDTLTYYPRYGPDRWGAPEDPPAEILPEYVARYQAIQKRKNRNWRENGVMGPNGESTIPNTGLHINKRKGGPPPKGKPSPRPLIKDYPQSRLEAGANEVPAFDDMPSLTFVSADDGTKAYAALQSFQTAPELQPWQQVYGQRAKAYSLADFKHTGMPFKLDEDRTFAKTGFVALVQPDAPDENDEAVVNPIYEFLSPAEFAGSLRNIKPSYDPNPPDAPPLSDEWQPWHYATGGGLILGTAAMLAIASAYRKKPTPMF